MNPYEQKRRWKFILLAFAVVIAGVSLFYSYYLVKNIAVAERTKAQVWAMSTKKIVEIEDINDDFLTFIYSVRDSLTLPAIVANERDSIIYWKGLDSTKTNIPQEASLQIGNQLFNRQTYDPNYFKLQLTQMKAQHQPIVITKANGEKWYVYYKDSQLLTQLRVFPYIQLTIIAIFLFIAYAVFSSSRRSEQNLVWVGMAKETAHQLGTPISSLMAWLELLEERQEDKEDYLVKEMQTDVKRLEMVADRFSKIGSTPVLQSNPVYPVVNDYVNYFRVRTSSKIQFIVKGDHDVEAMMNIPLFDWVVENLLKNAVNAIEGEGRIEIEIIENLVKEQVVIDVTDSGKGIPRLKFETIFQPGYTTRKRGWGLGLSLTRRIVENYHKGEIFVKDSEPGKGTTMRIILKSSTRYEPATS